MVPKAKGGRKRRGVAWIPRTWGCAADESASLTRLGLHRKTLASPGAKLDGQPLGAWHDLTLNSRWAASGQSMWPPRISETPLVLQPCECMNLRVSRLYCTGRAHDTGPWKVTELG